MIESRTVLPERTSPTASRRHGLPSEPVPTTTLPDASVVLMQLNRMFPQISVGRTPFAMRLRPYDDPNEPPPATNAGTGSASTFCTFAWNVVRNVHSRSRRLIGTSVRPASKPRVDICPPLIVWLESPELCGSGNVTSRSLITRS